MIKRQKEIPVYLFMGFLESGKTSFIQDTLEEDYFNDGQTTLIFACEEGEEEYDDEILEKAKSIVVYVEDEEDFTTDFINGELEKIHPDRVIIEYNGMWMLKNLFEAVEGTPLDIFQTLTMANAETFDIYMNNMRSLAVEMFKISEVVVINRCTKDTPKSTYRRSIRAVNRRVQVIFESETGDDMEEEEESLPFDIDGKNIRLDDEDYGIWFIDAMERPELYDGKTITMKVRVLKGKGMPKGCFVPGRHAMTCCADDVQFLGYLCHMNHAKSSSIRTIKNGMWATLTAEIKVEYAKEYKEKGPVLYAKRMEAATRPEEEFVYF